MGPGGGAGVGVESQWMIGSGTVSARWRILVHILRFFFGLELSGFFNFI